MTAPLFTALNESLARTYATLVLTPQEADLWSKVRDRLASTASKLLGWESDPLAKAKQVKAIDV